jgi:hypothetical protein
MLFIFGALLLPTIGSLRSEDHIIWKTFWLASEVVLRRTRSTLFLLECTSRRDNTLNDITFKYVDAFNDIYI